MKRVVVPELLDTDAGTPHEVAQSIMDLRMFNRSFGGVRTVSSLLRRIAAKKQLQEISWVDVAGSDGFVAVQAQKALAQSGIKLLPVMLDRAATHMNGATPSVCGDALALPFHDDSFDVVGSSLFLHHLEPAEI